MIDWEARIAELVEAERSAMAQFNFISGRLEELRALYAMATEEGSEPNLSVVEEVDA